jgi:hypothetical protein
LKYLDKSQQGRQSPEALVGFVKSAAQMLNGCIIENKYTNNVNHVVVTLFEQFLIHLTDQQAMALMANYMSDDLDQLSIEKEDLRQPIYNWLSNLLIGINWPQDLYQEDDLEVCELMWLMQSQADRTGLKVVHHSGEEVDVSIKSLHQCLHEISIYK